MKVFTVFSFFYLLAGALLANKYDCIIAAKKYEEIYGNARFKNGHVQEFQTVLFSVIKKQQGASKHKRAVQNLQEGLNKITSTK